MAKYKELADLMRNTDLLDQTAIAVVVAANTINTDKGGTPPTNQAQRETWANETVKDPHGMAKRVLPLLLAKYGIGAAVTVQNIMELTDEQMQTGVTGIIDLFAGS